MQYRTMNQSIIDPPPPPNVPPPQQYKRGSSRRLRSDRSLSSSIQTNSDAGAPSQTIRQEESDISASARTLPHQNTAHVYNDSTAGGPATRDEEAKTALHALEIDNVLPDAHFSKFPRMLPWSKHPLDVGMDGIMAGIASDGSSVEGMYYGDVMTSFPLDDADSNNFSTDSTNGTSQTTRFQRLRKTVADSLRSSFSLKSNQSIQESDDDNESLSDFKDWTPPDSAYGAAFPICGWVPKHYRRVIEASIIALFVFVLVFLVVTTSIRLSSDRNSKNTGNSTNNNHKVSDDDYYIDYDNYDYNNNENDDVIDGDDYLAGDDDAAAMAGDDVNVNDDGDAAANDDQEQDANDDDDDGGRLFLRLF